MSCFRTTARFPSQQRLTNYPPFSSTALLSGSQLQQASCRQSKVSRAIVPAIRYPSSIILVPMRLHVFYLVVKSYFSILLDAFIMPHYYFLPNTISVLQQ
ncbi:hypothetical protein BDW02DRAFT_570325 [Decorospora gaudefroyi]|uniref:Uncharacterized protein n=1 Tax=Decorospora gaudefroyi TaxID=184978 RepID=A0A6A5KCS6_9PLEO|nr:hypothetical protein BDW02DRAFT_570325 [Decorospora gaudefroyi]